MKVVAKIVKPGEVSSGNINFVFGLTETLIIPKGVTNSAIKRDHMNLFRFYLLPFLKRFSREKYNKFVKEF